MKKVQAKKQIVEYLKNNHIPYQYLNETDKPQAMENLDTLYLSVHVPEVIGKYLETEIRFRENHLYCQSCYCQRVVQADEGGIFRAARIINYINANLCYKVPYEPKLFLDEDHGDIYVASLIRYEVLEQHFHDTMSYILDFQVQFLKDVCVPIVFYINEKWDFERAARMEIDHKLMGKP